MVKERKLSSDDLIQCHILARHLLVADAGRGFMAYHF